MFCKLIDSLRHLLSVRSDQKKHDAALAGYLEELGIRVDGKFKVAGNRFDIVSFEDAEGCHGLCTYGLSGFLLFRGTDLVRAELLIYLADEFSSQLLERIGKSIYMSYEFPRAGENRVSATGDCFQVLKQRELVVSNQRARKFIAIEIAPC